MNDSVPAELLDAGRSYEKLFVPALFAVWTEHLIRAASVGPGDSVADIACGTGVLARDALLRTGRSGRVTGVDVAPGMIATASELEPRIDWQVGNAESLPLTENSFDCVLSQFGMMFFRDRSAAAGEFHRILNPGGRLAVAVWNHIDENPVYGAIVAVLREEVSDAAANSVEMPFVLGDPSLVVSLLETAGFKDVEIETRSEIARFPGIVQLVEAELRGWLPLFDIHLSESKITQVLNVAQGRLARYASSSGEAVFPMSGHVISARK